jgi:hypothetical protein
VQQQPKHKHRQQPKLQHSKQPQHAAMPSPSSLVLPQLPRAPLIGRVPPSSRAAAAASAALLQPGDLQAAAAGRAAVQGRQRSRAAAPSQQEQEQQQQLSEQQQLPESLPQPALPWDVVAALAPTSCFSLERLADASLPDYIAYLRAARMGMPSVFDLGVVRQQGRRGRMHLLRRELLLQHLAAEEAAVPSVERLQELSGAQLAAAAQAAVASGAAAAAGATASEVEECLIDFFVFRR